MMRKGMLMTIIASAALAACSGEPSPEKAITTETLRAVADRFDRAQMEQNVAELEQLVADDFVYIASSGKRQGKKEFIGLFSNPDVTFDPVTITDPLIVPLGPEAGIVGGDVVFSGTANGERFASRIRFADTFRRIDGEWKAVYVQATKVPDDAPAQ